MPDSAGDRRTRDGPPDTRGGAASVGRCACIDWSLTAPGNDVLSAGYPWTIGITRVLEREEERGKVHLPCTVLEKVYDLNTLTVTRTIKAQKTLPHKEYRRVRYRRGTIVWRTRTLWGVTVAYPVLRWRPWGAWTRQEKTIPDATVLGIPVGKMCSHVGVGCP